MQAERIPLPEFPTIIKTKSKMNQKMNPKKNKKLIIKESSSDSDEKKIVKPLAKYNKKNDAEGSKDRIHKNVIRNGTHYKPAFSRYTSNPENTRNINVICDSCDKEHLKECVGYKDIDICMKCAGEISRSMKPHGRWSGIFFAPKN